MANKINENGLLRETFNNENISDQYELYIPKVLEYFQKMALIHSDIAGYTNDRLMELHRAWLIRSWSIDILSYNVGQTLTVDTWTTPSSKLQANRNFTLSDKEYQVCVQANSKWFLVDTTKNKPIKIDDDFFNTYIPSSIPNVVDSDYLKVDKLDSDTKIFEKKFDIIKEYIDINNHINNIVYIRYSLQLLAEFGNFKPVHLDALYIKEIKEDYNVKIKVYKLSNVFYFNFTDDDEDHIYASIKITI